MIKVCYEMMWLPVNSCVKSFHIAHKSVFSNVGQLWHVSLISIVLHIIMWIYWCIPLIHLVQMQIQLQSLWLFAVIFTPQSIRIVGASACVIFILLQKIQKMAKCTFWYQLTWVVLDNVQRAIKWLCVCLHHSHSLITRVVTSYSKIVTVISYFWSN